MHSALVRRYIDLHGQVPTENQLRAFERPVLEEAREWDLDWRGGGQLRGLELLAALQHFGVPTRMLDFTFNPLVALWFAVETQAPQDGRVFAIDVANRLVGRSTAQSNDPWWLDEPGTADSPWSTRSWIWRPPPIEERITRQQGCFVVGGVPSTQPARNIRTATGATEWRPLLAGEVRQCMSVPFVLISYVQATSSAAGIRPQGQPPRSAAFTLRIQNRLEIRKQLSSTFGLSARSLFPDLPGFARYARTIR